MRFIHTLRKLLLLRCQCHPSTLPVGHHYIPAGWVITLHDDVENQRNLSPVSNPYLRGLNIRQENDDLAFQSARGTSPPIFFP